MRNNIRSHNSIHNHIKIVLDNILKKKKRTRRRKQQAKPEGQRGQMHIPTGQAPVIITNNQPPTTSSSILGNNPAHALYRQEEKVREEDRLRAKVRDEERRKALSILKAPKKESILTSFYQDINKGVPSSGESDIMKSYIPYSDRTPMLEEEEEEAPLKAEHEPLKGTIEESPAFHEEAQDDTARSGGGMVPSEPISDSGKLKQSLSKDANDKTIVKQYLLRLVKDDKEGLVKKGSEIRNLYAQITQKKTPPHFLNKEAVNRLLSSEFIERTFHFVSTGEAIDMRAEDKLDEAIRKGKVRTTRGELEPKKKPK